MAETIPIQIRDEIASLMSTNMTIANGYRYNMGDINVYEVANTESWPVSIIVLGDETTRDQQAAVDQSLYENVIRFTIIGKWKRSGDIEDSDSAKECENLVEDYKRFFGNYYQLADASAFVIFYAGHKKNYSNDNTYPSSVHYYIDVVYFQDRLNPSQGA